MATFMISFRIASHGDYAGRWDSTVNAIHKEAIDGVYWEETTSLVVIRSNKSADSLASSIFVGSEFNSVTDTLLVVNTSNSTHATRGKVDYPATLAGLFAHQNALSAILS